VQILRADLPGLARVLEFAEASQLELGEQAITGLLRRTTEVIRDKGLTPQRREVAEALAGLITSRGAYNHNHS
jgi:hypothetical protein